MNSVLKQKNVKPISVALYANTDDVMEHLKPFNLSLDETQQWFEVTVEDLFGFSVSHTKPVSAYAVEYLKTLCQPAKTALFKSLPPVMFKETEVLSYTVTVTLKKRRIRIEFN